MYASITELVYSPICTISVSASNWCRRYRGIYPIAKFVPLKNIPLLTHPKLEALCCSQGIIASLKRMRVLHNKVNQQHDLPIEALELGNKFAGGNCTAVSVFEL